MSAESARASVESRCCSWACVPASCPHPLALHTHPRTRPSFAPPPHPPSLRCFFVEPRNGMFDGPVYAGNNDGQRFDFFCKVGWGVGGWVAAARQGGTGDGSAGARSPLLPAQLPPAGSRPPGPHPPSTASPPVRTPQAALEFLLRTGRQPDILHCHDWSTADVARSYWQDYHQYGLWKPRVVSCCGWAALCCVCWRGSVLVGSAAVPWQQDV